MWKDSIRNIVVIFQTTILRYVGFYVRRSAYVFEPIFVKKSRKYDCGMYMNFFDKIGPSMESQSVY